MAGFGRAPFGKGPFGRSDLGGDLLIELFPESYFDQSLALGPGETVRDNDKDPLLMLLRTFRESVNKRRLEIEALPSLLDYESAPLTIIQLWGEMLGLGIDKNDPEFLQRSFLGNASQWLQQKGSRRGYEIRGLASGFTVSVENFWRISDTYAAMIPERHKFNLRVAAADSGVLPKLHTDSPPGTYPGTPSSEGPGYTKSSFLRVVFEVAEPRQPNLNYNTLLDLVISKIKDVVAIHHELLPPVFQVRINANLSASSAINPAHEVLRMNAMAQGVFDDEPADLWPVDGRVVGAELAGAQVGLQSQLGVSMTSTIARLSSAFPAGVNVRVVTELVPSEEPVLSLMALPKFDVTDADEMALDGSGTIG